MCLLFLCVGLFCVDLLRSYYYWQSLALHAHHAPVWPGSHRRTIYALMERTYCCCIDWEQLHPEKLQKTTQQYSNKLSLSSWVRTQQSAGTNGGREVERAAATADMSDSQVSLRKLRKPRGKLVAFVTPLAFSFTSPFVFPFLCSFALFSCHVGLQKASCLSVQHTKRIANISVVP